jgi:hypothetical protein
MTAFLISNHAGHVNGPLIFVTAGQCLGAVKGTRSSCSG